MVNFSGYEQPRINDLSADQFGEHIDERHPGLQSFGTWTNRSDVKFHTGENEHWDENRPDMVVHTGDEATAKGRGGEYLHRLRIPPSHGRPLTDAGANQIHASLNTERGWDVSDSVSDSIDDAHGSPGRAPTRDDEFDIADGEVSLPYFNTGEGNHGNISYISNQSDVRTWSGDVRDKQALSEAHGGAAPSPWNLSNAQFMGNRAPPEPDLAAKMATSQTWHPGRGTDRPLPHPNLPEPGPQTGLPAGSGYTAAESDARSSRLWKDSAKTRTGQKTYLVPPKRWI